MAIGMLEKMKSMNIGFAYHAKAMKISQTNKGVDVKDIAIFVLITLFVSCVSILFQFVILANQKKIDTKLSRIERLVSQKIHIAGWECVPAYKVEDEK